MSFGSSAGETMEIAGKVAIVTGGGSGIGEAMVLRLASLGARVLVVDVDDVGGAHTVEQVEGMPGVASFLHVDVTSPAELAEMVAEAVRRYGGLDILHNNAGITTAAVDFAQADILRIEAVVRTNLLGVMLGTQAALPALAKSKGVILNTASASGLRAWTNDPVYSATKAGVVFFTQALAEQLKPQGIRINAVCPGVVRTPLVGKSVRVQQMGEAERAQFDAMIKSLPLIEPVQVIDVLIDQITNDALTGETRYVGNNVLPPEGQAIGGVI
jgi:NAD(P)-dependent dehydrogenase (short-subunit alcohol dehydrogenase family)